MRPDAQALGSGTAERVNLGDLRCEIRGESATGERLSVAFHVYRTIQPAAWLLRPGFWNEAARPRPRKWAQELREFDRILCDCVGPEGAGHFTLVVTGIEFDRGNRTYNVTVAGERLPTREGDEIHG